jgi:RNA polymerase sigma factor (sigma-70 family)
MDALPNSHLMADTEKEIAATVLRESLRLGNFIRRRVRDPTDAEDILQDVFYEFVEACRLPAPIEHASAWLYQVARNRIVDRFRKKRELALDGLSQSDEEEDGLRLDLALPSTEDGPEAAYARSILLKALEEALGELPEKQREVFIGHEIDGQSFQEMSAQLGVGVNTLLARKRYAVLKLRERLQTVYDELEF